MSNVSPSAKSALAPVLPHAVADPSGPGAHAGRWQARLKNLIPTLNVGVSWASNFILVGGTFVVTPAILSALGEEKYGIWLLVMSFIGHMKILDLGMTSGCMKFSAAYYESGDRARLVQVFDSSVAIFGASGLLALLMTAALMRVLPALYPATLGGTEGLIAALGISMGLDLFCRPYAASLRGRSLFFVYDGIEIITYVIFKVALVLYLSRSGLSLWGLCVLSVLESVVRNAAVLGAAMRQCSWITLPRPWRAERAMMLMLIGYSGAMFLMALADMFRFQIQAAVIGYHLPDAPEQISIYGIGFRLILIASTTIGVVWSVLIPKFSGLSEKKDTEGLWALYRKASLNNGLLTVFGLVNIGVFGLPFLTLWIDKPWIPESYLVLLIALPGYFMAMLAGPANGLLAGTGRLKWVTAMTLIEALCNVGLSIALVDRLGIHGVTLGMALPMFVFRGVLFPLVLRREFNLKVREYWRIHARCLAVALFYSLITAALAFVPYRTFFELFIGCVCSTGVFGVLVYFLVPEWRATMARLPLLRAFA